MKPAFKEEKTTQAAALLLKLRKDKMSYMKLIKLLYLADREALLEWGRPITFDSYVSMKAGPVLSRTLNLINEGAEPGKDSFWNKHISPPQNYDVELKDDPGIDELSEAEIALLERIFAQYGKMGRWDLINNVMHKLPEWRNPGGSSLPIEYLDIFHAARKTDIEADLVKEDIEALALLEMALGQS